ncbi:MAG TPA: AraC family transcriptional regulator [Chitinophaga sp.]|uniref:helix-turn-helix transcriptional regulator n=1 Tax=Chitinophaga sp. TaxID=1869181 RepID=UPI002BE2A188|nr:AraC family transcriptional regulator [Chitinophaga sp.]HVI45485.1 AraC family transcriptional regulator [Chitinophaga sp.]
MKSTTIQLWNRKIQEAVAIAHDAPFNDIDLKKVADQLCVSVDIFSHKFTELHGESYKQFVKRSRLEAGAGYLRHSDYSISQISELCGYTNSSFSKAFRAMFHNSPVAFRDIPILHNEVHTLERTNIITAAHQKNMENIFTVDRTENVRLPNYALYYNILPSSNDPVHSLVAYMTTYTYQLQAIKASVPMSGAMIITGTLDVVPVTNYSRMMMYVGLLLPNTTDNDIAHLHIKLAFQEPFGLLTRRIPGGDYKKLPVPMSFAAAGLPMYQFINNNCRAGHFKMSSNHFFISLTGMNDCEIYIPWMKRTL